MIAEFAVDLIIFTGVAASCSPNVRIGDIVIAHSLVQHDMDASPIFPRYEIPLIGQTWFTLNDQWKEIAYRAAEGFLKKSFLSFAHEKLSLFNISSPQIHEGLIASGDKFFASQTQLMDLLERLPKTLCVEMEGAAVAQVCHEYQVPCVVIRTISDNGSEGASEHFQQFVTSIASHYSCGILEELVLRISS